MNSEGRRVTILTGEPTIAVLAEMRLQHSGAVALCKWVQDHRPECMPVYDPNDPILSMIPHEDQVSDNEILVELAGRKCYDSFGLKAGRKSNAEYIAHTQQGDIPHASILYHAKMTFFFAGISRRVSHELIRNYVGADRSEEGNPSQESTRFTHHYGYFIAPPRYISPGTPEAPHAHSREDGVDMYFWEAMQSAYDYYLQAVERDCAAYRANHNGEEPKGVEKKRIYEAASSFLPHQAETSFIWTSNPAAIAKLVRERANEAADLEIQRFAKKLRRICVERWPNLFPQPFMRESCPA